jgi:hypothetical protein
MLLLVTFCCFFLRRRRKKTPRITAARRAIPPTTPPAMAPTGVDFLRFPSVPPDEGVRGIGASEGPREAIVESGVKDKETGVFEDESVLGEVDESTKGNVSQHFVEMVKGLDTVVRVRCDHQDFSSSLRLIITPVVGQWRRVIDVGCQLPVTAGGTWASTAIPCQYIVPV